MKNENILKQARRSDLRIAKKLDILHLFSLTPDKAVEYLKSKGYIVTKNWMELWKEANTRAFTVAGVMKEDILKDIKTELDRAVQNNQKFSTFQKNLNVSMAAKGWNLSNSRLKLIYETNKNIAYSVGRYDELNSITQYKPYWQYVAVMDAVTRPEHAMLNGKVFAYDDPFWNFFYPPNGFNCRCRVVGLTKIQLKRRDLSVENTQNGELIKDETVEIGRIGEKRTVSTKSYKGIKIDAGWDYNPAKDYLRTK